MSKTFDMLEGEGGLQKFRARPGETAQGPEDPGLQRFKLEAIPAFIKIRYKNRGKFPGQDLVARHDFAHDFRNTPPDPPGFLVQLPHESAHPIPARLKVISGQIRNIYPHGQNG